MTYTKTILIVEDEKGMIDLLKAILSPHDYKVIDAQTGEEALRMRQNYNPDLILLDLGLPDLDGIEVLRGIRKHAATPVIVISARQDESDKVEALDNGATDYMTKPFGNFELLARIRNTIRLHEKLSLTKNDEDVFLLNGFCINYDAYRVLVNEKPVHLTPIEYKIVELLSRHVGRVLTHEQIINQVWGPNNCDYQVLRVNMANIRRKVERNPADPKLILTELGVGYRMGDALTTP